MRGGGRGGVGLMHGREGRIEAISGQDTIENRANVVNFLGQLATRVLATGESLWYDGATEDLPPQVERALDRYVDESHTRTLAVRHQRRWARACARAVDAGGRARNRQGSLASNVGGSFQMAVNACPYRATLVVSLGSKICWQRLSTASRHVADCRPAIISFRKIVASNT